MWQAALLPLTPNLAYFAINPNFRSPRTGASLFPALAGVFQRGASASSHTSGGSHKVGKHKRLGRRFPFIPARYCFGPDRTQRRQCMPAVIPIW